MDWLNAASAFGEKISKLRELDKQELAYRTLPHVLGATLSRYFRISVTGQENLPKRGAGLITPNHSGYSGFDAFLLGHQIQKILGRRPQILTHKLWFTSKWTSLPMQQMGFVKATKDKGLEILNAKDLLMIFPEGEAGNFKPSLKRYHLQKFKRGTMRMALRTQSPIIPTLVIGAEETHINLARLNLDKYMKGQSIPLPLNLIPLPVKWHIHFLEPIELPYPPEKADDSELVHELTEDLREAMQARLSREVKMRSSIFF